MTRFEYEAFDDALWDELRRRADAMEIYRYLLDRLGGRVEDALRAMEQLRRRGALPPGFDLDAFREQLEENRLIAETPDGDLRLTPKGERTLRERAFEEIFRKLRVGGSGGHAMPHGGGNGEPLPEKRPWEFGDDLRMVDFPGSMLNAARRGYGGIEERDLEVHETERATGCATVLLIDVSHSMVLYGEDRITPAKRVALAFQQLIATRYPKDDLEVVLFGDDAVRVPAAEIPYIEVGPFHTNTQMGLRTAREILARKKQPNRQIFMITDGKPSMIREPDGSYYKNSFGLDPKIVSKTLDEAQLCRKKGIPITTFMVTDDELLKGFVERLSELNRGRAFFADLDDLGKFLVSDYIANRRR